MEYSKSSTGADKKTGQKFAKVHQLSPTYHSSFREVRGITCDLSSGLQGDARFVLTTKGARILLSLKSASEELQPVLEEAKDFSPLSFKVAIF